MKKIIRVGARSSPLSLVQLEEVQQLIHLHYPHITFEPVTVMTTGDLDQKSSLRMMGKSDFFTKEVDNLLLTGKCRIAIHSAKDLPDPLPKGVVMIALTKGLDPSDSLVFRLGESLHTLPPGATIATSSERREEAVKQLRTDLCFIDIRGTIQQRLNKLETHQADAVVVAEAALIRLGLTHLNRMRLPGETVPNQGQLAIMARHGDDEMETLFRILDCRR